MTHQIKSPAVEEQQGQRLKKESFQSIQLNDSTTSNANGERFPFADAKNLGFYDEFEKTAPSKHLSLNCMVELIQSPYSQADKKALPLITPFDGNAKTKEAAATAKYWASIVDFDGVAEDIHAAANRIRQIGYTGALLGFTTSSHGTTVDNKGNKKEPHNYKFIIPFDRGADVATAHALSKGLCLLLGADAAQSRIQQGFFAPNSQTMELPYEGVIDGLNNGYLTPDCQLYIKAVARFEQEEAKKLAKATAAPLKPKPKAPALASSNNIISLINDAYPLEGLLNNYGHKLQGKAWLSPNSSSGSAGGHILDGGRFYSHHGSCILGAGNNDGHSLDAADVLCLYQYGGDYSAMVKDQASKLDPEGEKQRRRDYMAEQEQLRDAAPINTKVIEKDLSETDADELGQEAKNQERLYKIIKDTAIGRRAKDLALAVEMPTDTVCLTGLGVVSSVAAGAFTVERRGGYGVVPMGLYVAPEQPPSTGKSYSVDGFRGPILSRLIATNKKYVEQVKQAAKDAGEDEPKYVPALDLFKTNATPEALEQILINNNGFFSVIADEQAAIDTLLGLTYKDKNGSNNNGLVLNGFAGEYFSSARVSRDAYVGTPYGGLTVLAQAGTARKIVQGSQGQGVVERFLLWNEPNLLGTRTFDYHEMTTEAEYSKIAANLVKLVTEQFAKKEALENLPRLTLSHAGYKAIHSFRRELEPLLADNGKYSHPLLRGAAGKADMQIMKVAATLHIADECLEIGAPNTAYWQPSQEVADKYVLMAVDLVRVVLEQLTNTLEASGIIGRNAFADAVAEYLERRHKPMTARAITQNLKNRPMFKDTGSPTKYVREALEHLIKTGIIVATQQQRGGRMEVVYKM